MKTKLYLVPRTSHLAVCLVLLSTLSPQFSTGFAQGTAFTYQGVLSNQGAPANGTYDLRFGIFDVPSGGSVLSTPVTNAAVGVTNGLFAVTLDFGIGMFDGSARWLQIDVRTNGDTGLHTTLSPRQSISPSPYAIRAAAVAWNGVAGVPLNLTSNMISSIGSNPLEFEVNGTRALRLELNTVPDFSGAPNVIGGSPSNFISSGVVGATVAGGGAESFFGFPFANRVAASFATVGGGGDNSSSGDFATIGGGQQNRASGYGSVVSGGSYNAARATSSTIGGGNLNSIATNAERSVISGGEENTVSSNTTFAAIVGGSRNTNSGPYATIGGGSQNRASEFYATVPGGRQNSAAGYASFAAGNRAKALHDDTFVWADGQSADFASTGINQFLIRASGGVGIGITNPASALHVVGTVTANALTGSGAGISNVNATALGGLNSSNFWKLGGNAGANPANGNFIGTTDNLPLELRVNGGRALRLEPNTNGAPNLVGGSQNNFVSTGVVGATIAGGGAALYGSVKYTNSVTGNFGTVSGGAQNTVSGPFATVGGGYGNTTSSNYATVGGGDLNLASETFATVGGGNGNTASGRYSTVGAGDGNTASAFHATVGGGGGNTASGTDATVSGGSGNTATALYATVGAGQGNSASNTFATVSGGGVNTAGGNSATVGGGYGNTASGNYATVVGGSLNTAGGDYSFAAGLRAKANHQGAFVWADSQLADLTTTANDQFLIRAQGGVGIGNNNPQAPLHVNGGGDASLSAGGNFISGLATGQNIVIDNNEIISRNNGTASDLILNVGSGNVGIGRTPTANRLEVGGEASKATAGNWLANSDARIKTGVQTVTNALDKLSRVRLVQFRYTDDYRAAHPGITDREYLNVVAQEFQKVFPEDVKRSGEKLASGEDILQVDTYPLTIYAAAAVQELNLKVKERDARISALEHELSELKQALQKLSGRKD